MFRFIKSLGGQLLIGMIAGVLLGHFVPDLAVKMKPLGDIFLRAIKMIVSPLVLCVVTVGVARVGGAGRFGRIGGKALVYFKIMTTLALLLGLAVGNIFQPGAGINADPKALDAGAVTQFAKAAPPTSVSDFVVNLLPANIIDSLAKGEILQILVFAILFGLALQAMGQKMGRLADIIDDVGHALIKLVGIVMRVAPIAAFGALALAVGNYGLDTLGSLVKLMACLYGASAVFVVVLFVPITIFGCGLNPLKLMRYFREEILVVLAAASSETVLPRVLEKLEALGCSRTSVGLVIPAAYSFNLVGSCIYMTLAPLFIAQALNIHLSFEQQAGMFALLLLTSNGMAGVGGAALVVIATTLTASHVIPLAGMALILGIDRIQNEVRTLLNMMGNVIAGIVIARSENEFDLDRARKVLDGTIHPLLDEQPARA